MSSCVKGHCQSHLCGKMEKEKWGKWRNRWMWKSGKIVSAPIPRAEAFCRSCLNSIEGRTANGDGCWCSFTLSTRKQEKLKNKYIKKKTLVLKGGINTAEGSEWQSTLCPVQWCCKFRWAGTNYGFKKSLAKLSLFVKKFLGALTIQTMMGKESSRNSHHTPFHTFQQKLGRFCEVDRRFVLRSREVCLFSVMAKEQLPVHPKSLPDWCHPGPPGRCGRSHTDNQTSQVRLGQWPAEVLRNLSTPSWNGKSNQTGILCFKKGAFLEDRQIATGT